MRFLSDKIAACSPGVSAWTSSLPVEIVQRAALLSKPLHLPFSYAAVLDRTRGLVDAMPSSEAASRVLANLHSSASRLACLDACGPCVISALEYVDDVVAPASSSEQIDVIWRSCLDFTDVHGGSFNHGPEKTAILGIGGTRVVSDSLVHVGTYRYLGVLLDQYLTLEPHLQSNLARANKAYLQLHGSILSACLPVPLLAAAVPLRVVPVALYGIEFCIATSGAEAGLNRMQVSWAKHVLGFGTSRAGIWSFVVRECGWSRRLGTCMLARAILLKARILLLPLLHPAARLVVLLSSSSIDTWLLRVSQLQCRPDFSSIIPDLSDVFAEGRISHARGDAGARRSLLRSYRKLWVDPVLDACDVDALSKAASNSQWPYGGSLSSFVLADHVGLGPSHMEALSSMVFGQSYRPHSTVFV